jgi:hypothetical protein
LALDDFNAAAARVPHQEPTVNTSPQAIELALPLVKRLANLLPENNFAALECFSELKGVVGKSPSLVQIEDALERLDFQAAIPHLATLELELARPFGFDQGRPDAS